MKKLNIIISILLCVVMLFACAGCDTKTPGVDPGGDPDETIDPNDTGNNPAVAELKSTTIKLGFRYDNSIPVDYEEVVKAINAKLDWDGKPYKVEFSFYAQTNYVTNIETDAKQEGLDAAFVFIDDFATLIDRGTLMNVYPYLQKHGKEVLAKGKSYTWRQVTDSKTGRIFGIPRNVPLAGSHDTIAIRKDWMQAVGMTKVETIDEYIQYCSKIKGMDGIGKGKNIYGNDIEPASFFPSVGEHNNVFALRELAPSYYYPIVDYAQRPVYVDMAEGLETGKYKVKNFYAPNEDTGEDTPFIKWSQFSQDMVQAGYSPAGGPASVSGIDFRFSSGGNLGSLWNVILKTSERIDGFKANAYKANVVGAPDPDIYDVFLNPNQPKYVTKGADNIMAVLSQSKNPNEVIDFLNWLKTPESDGTYKNYDLFCYGVEGKNYYASEKTINKNGKEYKINYLSFTKDGSPTIPVAKRYSVDMPYWTLSDIDLMRWSTNLSDDYIISRLEWELDDVDGNPVNYVVSPLVGFNIDYSNVALKNAKMNVMAELGYATEFANGRSFLNDKVGATGKTKYAALLENVRSAGMETLIAEIQKQVDAYIASQLK